jgi:membrane protein YdbS with pleckstrin-like domain
MKEVPPLELLVQEALAYLSVALLIIVPAATAYWAWTAFRCSKKNGYLFVAVFALTPYANVALQKVSYAMHKEEVAKLNAQRKDGILVIDRPVSLPIYHLVLAAGIFLLARAEKKRANQSPEPTATSVTPPAAQEPRQP